jgi:hypothetical protein
MQDFNSCAEQLTAALPAQTEGTTYAAGGILSKIMALVGALKAGDVTAILKAVYDLLGEFVSDGTTNFSTPLAGFGLDFKTLMGILATILGLLGK